MNKTKIILVILLLIFVTLTTSTIYDIKRQENYINIKQKQTFSTIHQVIDGKIIFFRKMFSTRMKNILHSRLDLQNAIKSHNLSKIKQSMDKIFRVLQKENRYSKTFHLISPDNISIYRAHKPDKHGDDLTGVRPMVNFVNRYKRSKYGFEVGVYAIVYRVDIPIFYDNKYYGVLEYGLDPNMFISDLSMVSNYIKSAIIVNRDNLPNPEGIKAQDKYSKTITINGNQHLLIDDEDFFKYINLDINNDLITQDDKYYSIYMYDLFNFKAKNIGHIVIALDITEDHKQFESIIKISIINQIVLLVVILLIIYYAFNYYESRIHELIAQEKENDRILQQQSKMAAMGEMIGNIAHQWRQPLSSISTIASGIQVQKEYGIFDESTLDKSMQSIVDQTQYMSKTINDFRDFFKPDKEKKDINIKDIIEKNIDLIKYTYRDNNIEIIKENIADTIIKGYENELTQAILNILNNAKDQLKQQDIDKKFVKISIEKDTDFVTISIIDNGGGIPEHILPKIFEPYFTTKHKSQGTGIGLYMTYEIIEKHFNGNIKAYNTKVKYEDDEYVGARFDIILPIA